MKLLFHYNYCLYLNNQWREAHILVFFSPTIDISVINRFLTPTVTLSTQNFGEICTKPPEPEFHFHLQEKKENIAKIVCVPIIAFLLDIDRPCPLITLRIWNTNKIK